MNHDEKMERDEAFARWYTLHHPRIRRLCAGILRDQALAEDMAQESLLRAWERRDAMREEDLGAWLSVVARNLCISALRRDKHLVSLEPLPDRADHSNDPETTAERRETGRNVRRALSKLSERHRRVIYLHEVADVDYEEIGEELGVGPEGVRSIAFRARRVMREHLAAVGEGFGAWIFGIRIRIFQRTERLRGLFGATDGGGAAAFQAGMNLAIAASLALATLTSTSILSAPGSANARPALSAALGGGAASSEAAAIGASVGASAGHRGSMSPGTPPGGLLPRTPASSVPPPAKHDPDDDVDQIGYPITVPIVDQTIPPIYWSHTPGTTCYTCDSRDLVFYQVCKVDPRACVE
jgi:RNA polymerase sigma-70 factor (ECF subfamily)